MKARRGRKLRGRNELAWLGGAIITASRAHGQFTTAPGGAPLSPGRLGQGAAASPTPAIRDIAPPLDVFPYPMWMVLTAAGIALLLLALLIYGIVRFVQSRPKAAPPTPRQRALARLREAEKLATEEDPYVFSIRVSDILREYIAARYGLQAREQTSPEFLAAVSRSPHFAAGEKDLLALFLERCDLIKFARLQATCEESKALVAQAIKFVEGGPE